MVIRDDHMEMHEVKGGYKTPQGWLKFKVAASQYPMFKWFLIEYKGKDIKNVTEY